MIETRGLTKRFGAVTALEGVDFELRRGEILALLGDNGAGKSTFVKCLSGYHRADEGEIRVGGVAREFPDPQAARAAGIETIYQDLALFDNMDVAANVFAGQEARAGGLLGRLGFVDRRAMRRRAAEAVARMAVTIPDMGRTVEHYSGGQRQCVAIARALLWGRRVVIMDEPTAALGVRETAHVLDLIRGAKAEGLSVILIMHNVEHVMQVAERAVVMRAGRRRGAVDITEPRGRGRPRRHHPDADVSAQHASAPTSGRMGGSAVSSVSGPCPIGE